MGITRGLIRVGIALPVLRGIATRLWGGHCEVCGREDAKENRRYPLNDGHSPFAAAASTWPRASGGRRARRYCRSFAGWRPHCRDADWSTLPSNLDDDSVGSPGGGRYSAVVCWFSNLFRRNCAVWRRQRPWICRSRHFGARVVWIIPVSGADGAPCAPYFNVNGSISIPRRDCLSSRRGKLNSRTYYVPRSCKRVAGHLALEANTNPLSLVVFPRRGNVGTLMSVFRKLARIASV